MVLRLDVGRGAADPELHQPQGHNPWQCRLRHVENSGRIEGQVYDGNADESHHEGHAYDRDGVDSLHARPPGHRAAAETGG